MTPMTPRPISTDLHRGSKSSNVFTCFFFKVWGNIFWVDFFEYFRFLTSYYMFGVLLIDVLGNGYA